MRLFSKTVSVSYEKLTKHKISFVLGTQRFLMFQQTAYTVGTVLQRATI